MNITSKRLKKAAIPQEKPKQHSYPLRPYSNLSSQNFSKLRREMVEKKPHCKAVWLNIYSSCTNNKSVWSFVDICSTRLNTVYNFERSSQVKHDCQGCQDLHLVSSGTASLNSSFLVFVHGPFPSMSTTDAFIPRQFYRYSQWGCRYTGIRESFCTAMVLLGSTTVK